MNIIKQCKYGKMIFIDKDLWVGRSLDIYGQFSEGEIDLLKVLIEPGDVVLDIGSNIGTHSLAFSQFVGSEGVVYSFEPVRLLYYMLCGNVALNNIENITCYQKVVGNVSGVVSVPEIDLVFGDNFAATVLQNYRNMNGNLCSDLSRTQEVSAIKIDELNLEKCNLIKVDVEGMEVDVIRGALKTIVKHQPWLYLENDPYCFDVIACNNLIYDLGYTVYQHEPYHFQLDNFNCCSDNVFGNHLSRNMLCVPPGKKIPEDLKKFIKI